MKSPSCNHFSFYEVLMKKNGFLTSLRRFSHFWLTKQCGFQPSTKCDFPKKMPLVDRKNPTTIGVSEDKAIIMGYNTSPQNMLLLLGDYVCFSEQVLKAALFPMLTTCK